MTKKLFTLRDSLPWAIGTLLAAFVTYLVIRYAEGITEPAFITLATVGVFLAIVFRHYWDRWVQVRAYQVAPKLWPDVPVFGDTGTGYFFSLIPCTGDVLVFWKHRERYGQLLAKAFCYASPYDGCYVTLVPQPFMVNGVLAGGKLEGKHATIVGAPACEASRTKAYLRHELGHLILNFLGIDPGPNGENHHRIFAEEKFGA